MGWVQLLMHKWGYPVHRRRCHRTRSENQPPQSGVSVTVLVDGVGAQFVGTGANVESASFAVVVEERISRWGKVLPTRLRAGKNHQTGIWDAMAVLVAVIEEFPAVHGVFFIDLPITVVVPTVAIFYATWPL